ncbi:MAG: hypothetical protein FWH05_02575 [Oscillospiraceae bacterium]|nr:hypothetical protein [Oscillospiraceae bacterium]
MIEDFKSDNYKKLVEKELLSVIELNDGSIVYSKSSLETSYEIADKLLNQTKETMECKKLDRHKLASVATIALILCSPIECDHQKKQKKQWYANEVLAHNVAGRILYEYSFREFCKSKGIAPDDLKKNHYFQSISYPLSIKDEFSVQECFLNALSQLRFDLIALAEKKDDPKIELVRLPVLLLSHIYFYMETHSLEFWSAKLKGREVENMEHLILNIAAK